MAKRESRACAERSHCTSRVIAQHHLKKYRPTYFNLRILSKVYDFRRRLGLWIYPKKDCFSCCLTYKYFGSNCQGELEL